MEDAGFFGFARGSESYFLRACNAVPARVNLWENLARTSDLRSAWCHKSMDSQMLGKTGRNEVGLYCVEILYEVVSRLLLPLVESPPSNENFPLINNNSTELVDT